jgi:hypothetical protein
LITFFIFPSKANADFIATVEESLQIADEGKSKRVAAGGRFTKTGNRGV